MGMRRTFFLTGSLDLFLITKLIVREFVAECPRSEWASEVQELLANAKEVVITTDMTGKTGEVQNTIFWRVLAT